MRRLALATLLAAAWLAAVPLLTPSVAEAKGPTVDELPTLEELYARAKAAKEAAEKAAIEAARDPRREAIEAYKTGTTPLAEFKPLTDMINDSKDDDVREYRRPAMTALVQRFRAEPQDDPNVRKLRAEAVLEILELMRAPSKDRVGLALIQDVLNAFWKNKVRDYGFQATGKPKDRYAAYKDMKKYLQSGERE